MSSVLKSQRTLKMRAFFRHNHVQAIIKLPQWGFSIDPHSEMLAFCIDRLLGFRRVPPTAWVHIPAAASDMPPRYVQWMNASIFAFPPLHRLFFDPKNHPLKTHGPIIDNFGTVFGVSVQLWMFDVHPVAQTSLRAPDNWFLYFDPELDWQWPEDHRSTRFLLSEICHLFIFDYLLSNGDRGSVKNNFAIGGCDAPVIDPPPARYRYKGRPQFIHLDQGSSFRKSPLARNPLIRILYNDTRLDDEEGAPVTLYHKLLEVAPAETINHVGHRALAGVQHRLDMLLHHIDHTCVGRFGEDKVFV